MSDLHFCILPRKIAKERGIKRYFTGKPCKHGHLAEKKTSDGKCVECHRLRKRQRYIENREEMLEQQRHYRAENRDKLLGRRRKHYAENRDRMLEHSRRYYAENRDYQDYCLEYSRQYRAENPEKALESQRKYRDDNREALRERRRQNYAENQEAELGRSRQWRYENPDYFRNHYAENRERYFAHAAKRRAAVMDRTISHEKELTQLVMEEAAQQASDMADTFGIDFHVDHMIPMQGEDVSGLHVWYNLQVIPALLNLSKSNRLIYTEPLEWLADFT